MIYKVIDDFKEDRFIEAYTFDILDSNILIFYNDTNGFKIMVAAFKYWTAVLGPYTEVQKDDVNSSLDLPPEYLEGMGI